MSDARSEPYTSHTHLPARHGVASVRREREREREERHRERERAPPCLAATDALHAV
jgi:hypothetical protein